MTTNSSGAAGPKHKVVEAGVALLIALFGVVVIIGSVKAGINWGAEGPRAGFFPFYIGLLIVVSSAINFWHVLRDGDGALFAEWEQLRQVMSVVIPTAIYVGSMPFTGLYLASIIFIGKYSKVKSAIVALATMTLFFMMFEVWFKVPLYKGTLEPLSFLGY